MATISDWTNEQRAAWESWVSSRPTVVQALCRRLPPDRLYRLKTSGHRVTLYSYNENNTVTVCVTGEYNRILFGRHVFGIKPDDLEECDLPAPDEDLGDISQEAGYSDDDVRDILIPEIRKNMHGQGCQCRACVLSNPEPI